MDTRQYENETEYDIDYEKKKHVIFKRKVKQNYFGVQNYSK